MLSERRSRTLRKDSAAVRLGGRLLLALLVGLGTIFLAFFALHMARGTPFANAMSEAARELGGYLVRLAHGDLGVTGASASTARRIPVAQVLAETLPRSLGLLGVALAVSTIVGVVLGTLAATSRRNLGASFLLFCSMLGASTPSFFLALLLQLLVLAAVRHAGHSVLPVGGFGWGLQLVLPTLVLAARPVSQIARITFVKTREALGEDYVRSALAKGAGSWRVMARHVARNVAAPVLTTAAISMRFALSSLPIVEVYFGWPGAGMKLLHAISDKDDNLTVALLLALALCFFCVQVLLDLVCPAIDPRIADTPVRAREKRGRRVSKMRADLAQRVRSVSYHPIRRLRSEVQAIKAWHPRPPRRQTKPPHAAARLSLQGANVPLLVGALICVGILVVVFFGSRLAPHSPYLMAGIERVGDNFRGPPFAPSDRFPWGTDGLGRDLMSLILTGAQLTLLLAAVAVASRMVVGVVLGAIGGWWSGSLADRVILGLAKVITPFPILLLAMLVIMAVGIRQGVLPFAVGLCVVGWGEIAQFARSEIVSLRARPFVESARAVGVRTPRLIASHLVPHLLPSLTALVAIEFSAVLMLLGELGFLGIFLGGGATAEVNAFAPLAQYSDIPEWGALLANFRPSARAYPWLVLAPSLALFVSSFGFHLLGEGIRREIERGRLALHWVFNRKALLAVGAAALGLWFLSGNLGPAAVYRKEALEFDRERAVQHVEALAASELGGREIGSSGAQSAAAYIAQEFKRLGVQPVGDSGGYFLADRGGFEELADVPTLSIDGGTPALRYRTDFGEYGGRFVCVGDAEGAVRVVLFGKTPSAHKAELSEFARLDLSRDVVLVLSPEDAEVLDGRACAALLVVSADPSNIERGAILSPESRLDPARVGTNFASTVPDRPSFWISAETAERILSGSGWTLASLRRRASDVDAKDPVSFAIERRAALHAAGSVLKNLAVSHVVGWIPGRDDSSVDRLATQVLVVLAQYDTSPGRPGDFPSLGVNDNASGVAVLLEIARLMTETEYVPNRSFLLVAYSGMGWKDGSLQAEPRASYFLSRLSMPTQRFTLEACVRLRSLGVGASPRLSVQASKGVRLSSLFKTAASRVGVGVDVSNSIPAEGSSPEPEAYLTSADWQEAAQKRGFAEVLSPRALERTGRAAALGLMILGREREY